MSEDYYIIMPEGEQIDYWAKMMHAEDEGERYYSKRFNLEGTKEAQDTFIRDLNTWCQGIDGYKRAAYIGEWEKDTKSMNGGLIFIGIFFGIIFSVCLVLMMYYKQLSEGFEDKKNFEILKQVLMVFFLPLVVGVIHTFIGLHIVKAS